MHTTIYHGGTIYTVDGADWQDKPVHALAVGSDGRIEAVGDIEEVRRAAGAGAKEVDLNGAVVLPGFIDGHCHCPGTALTKLFEIYLFDCLTLEETIDTVRDFVRAHPEKEMYVGSGFTQSIDKDPRGPRRELLDEICADKPIMLYDTGAHIVWLNTKCFEDFGITKETPPPQGGSIPINEETGELLGVLIDAFSLGIELNTADMYTDAEKMKAFLRFQDDMLGWGFTGVMSIWADFGVESDYAIRAEEEGLLKIRMNICHGAEPDEDFDVALAKAKSLRHSVAGSTRIRMETFKFYADGVAEGLTAFLTEPYAAQAIQSSGDHGNTYFRGEPHWNLETLRARVTEVYAEGFQIHVHSIGDAATEAMLDIFEYVQRAYPDGAGRNVLTHLELVRPEDKKRMGALGVVASVQPFWHFKEPGIFEEMDCFALGRERAEFQTYPVRTLLDEGVVITFSADHPVSSVNNPFWAIETAVTRNLNDGAHYGVPDIEDMDDPVRLRNPAERISVREAIEAYTTGSAYQLFREDETGSLTPGKQADFIVIDQDLFKINPVKISETKILRTVIGGETVYCG